MLKIPFEIPTYEIRRASPTPALNGWLDSPCWQGANWIDKFITVETGEATGKPTRAALLWDRNYLYVGVQCTDPQLALLRADAATDKDVWGDDTIEIYLDPSVKGVESMDTAVNTLGRACPALRIIDDPGWGTYFFREQDGIRTAVRLTGHGWQAEVAMPFGRNRLPRPKAGDRWRGNICRNDKLGFQWSYWALGKTPGYVYSDNKLFPHLRFSPRTARGTPIAGAALPVAPAPWPAVANRACAVGRRRLRCRSYPPWPRKPRFDIRGMMYDTSRGSIIYTADYWIRLLPQLKRFNFNSIIMYFENHMRYPSQPAFAPAGSWTLEDLRRLQNSAARHGIDIIPAQTSIGHCPGILTHPKYQHLAEDGSKGYQFCVSHPETPKVLEDIFTDLCRASRSPYVSINADESGYLGLCPRCRKEFRGWSRGRIFQHHILRLYEIVKAHGKRMMMWDDMLWTFPDAIRGLPRDIILLDWHYCLHRKYPSVDVWRKEGFDVVVCPGMYMVENAFWMADYGADRGATGIINTLWEDHSLPLGSRWQQFLATDWAGCVKSPADMEVWYRRAAAEFFGPAGERLGVSLAAQDLLIRNGHKTGSAPTTLELSAARQSLGEAEDLLGASSVKGFRREWLEEFVYARRLVLLQSEIAWRQARGKLDRAFTADIRRRAAALKREGLKRWDRDCTCPSQKPAFLERYAAIEKALGK